MRWFKHLAASRGHPKLKFASRRLGECAYARFFKVLEIICERGGSGEDFSPTIDLKTPHMNLEWLADELGVTPDATRETLAVFAEADLIDGKAFAEQIISVPAMVEYRDEYTTRRVGTSSRQYRESVRQEQSRVDQRKNRSRSGMTQAPLEKGFRPSRLNAPADTRETGTPLGKKRMEQIKAQLESTS